MERLMVFFSHYLSALIQNVKNLFLPKGERVYTGAIPEA